MNSIKKILSLLLVAFGVLVLHGREVAAVDLANPDELGPLLGLELRTFVAAKPIHLILVEKDRQRLRVLEHDGRLRVLAVYRIASGEKPGQKERQGDEKTPEGVYFITKIFSDTEVTVFGKRAFQLDYPNVFDRQEGKEGNGIFVHGTNRNLIANSTNGCITLNNEDLEDIVQYLPLGAVPVVVVSSLADLASDSISEARVREFVAGNFQGARKVLMPDAGQGQPEFTSLYMITANRQTVAVAEYQTLTASGALRREMARSYLDYAPDSGWTAMETIRMATGEKGPGTLASSGPLPSAQQITPRSSAMIRMAPPDASLWQDEETPYLAWYLDTLSAPALAVAGQEAEEALSELDERPLQKGSDYLVLFLLTVAASIGAAWLVVMARLRRDGRGVGGVDDGETAGQLAAITRIREDIAWTNDTLLQFRRAMATRIDAGGVAEKLQERVAELGGDLRAKMVTIQELSARNGALQDRVAELGEAKSKLEETRSEFDRLAVENETLREQAMKTSAEEQLTLRHRLHAMELSLHEGVAERHRLLKQAEKLPETLKELSEKKAEVDTLILENSRIQEMLQGATQDKEELERIRRRFAVVEAELVEGAQHRARLEEQLGVLVRAEEKLELRQAEIEELTARNAELKDLADEMHMKKDQAERLAMEERERKEEAERLAREERERKEEAERKAMEVKNAAASKLRPGGGVATSTAKNYLPQDVLQHWIGK